MLLRPTTSLLWLILSVPMCIDVTMCMLMLLFYDSCAMLALYVSIKFLLLTIFWYVHDYTSYFISFNLISKGKCLCPVFWYIHWTPSPPSNSDEEYCAVRRTITTQHRIYTHTVERCVNHFERARRCLKLPASRLFTQLFSQMQIKETSKLRVTGLCEGNSPVTGEFPAQRARNVENVSISWRHHV